MKLTDAIVDLECSLTDFNLAFKIEKTLKNAREQIVGDEPVENSPEHNAWSEKAEAFEELLELAGGMSDAVGEYDDAYTDFEEDHGKAPKDVNSPEFKKWFKDYLTDMLDEEEISAQDLFMDFKYAFDDFQDEYGGLDDLELVIEEK